MAKVNFYQAKPSHVSEKQPFSTLLESWNYNTNYDTIVCIIVPCLNT